VLGQGDKERGEKRKERDHSITLFIGRENKRGEKPVTPKIENNQVQAPKRRKEKKKKRRGNKNPLATAEGKRKKGKSPFLPLCSIRRKKGKNSLGGAEERKREKGEKLSVFHYGLTTRLEGKKGRSPSLSCQVGKEERAMEAHQPKGREGKKKKKREGPRPSTLA